MLRRPRGSQGFRRAPQASLVRPDLADLSEKSASVYRCVRSVLTPEIFVDVIDGHLPGFVPLDLIRFISSSLSENPTFCVQNPRFSGSLSTYKSGERYANHRSGRERPRRLSLFEEYARCSFRRRGLFREKLGSRINVFLNDLMELRKNLFD